MLARTVGDEIVLLQLSTETYYALSGSGAAMWKALLEHGTIEAAVPTLVERFDAPEETLRADFERFAADLAGRGLLSG